MVVVQQVRRFGRVRQLCPMALVAFSEDEDAVPASSHKDFTRSVLRYVDARVVIDSARLYRRPGEGEGRKGRHCDEVGPTVRTRVHVIEFIFKKKEANESLKEAQGVAGGN